MNRFACTLTVAALSLATACTSAARTDGRGGSGAEALVGTWRVDLRPTPDAPPYFQEFVVTRIDGKSFEGRFYGSPIANARLNSDWGVVHFAFTTGDGGGAYNSSGVLTDAGLSGTTHSIGREFLAVWTARRVD